MVIVVSLTVGNPLSKSVETTTGDTFEGVTNRKRNPYTPEDYVEKKIEISKREKKIM